MQPPIELLQRFLANEASAEEIRVVLQWLREHPDNEKLLEQAWRAGPGTRTGIPPVDKTRIWMEIAEITGAEGSGESGITRQARKGLLVAGPTLAAGSADSGSATAGRGTQVETGTPMRRIARWWPAAAAALILVLAAIYIVARNGGAAHDKAVQDGSAVTATDISPGRNGAVLTLADGSQVSLDSAGAVVPATQGSTKVRLTGNQLAYEDTGIADGAPLYNTVTTPRGRQFTLVLPDGSKVWLNAASSIRFPTRFSLTQRVVEVTGEAYIEVAKDKAKPFFLEAGKTRTEVLGTSFNVESYEEDEVTKTTLIDGRIRTGVGTDQVLLSPGEQAVAAGGKQVRVDHRANLDQVTAWKNGAFNFQGMGLQEVMRQLARWYDLEVVYESGVKDVRFGGEMSRNIPLSSLLNGLKKMDLHFRIQSDHRLIVMP